MAETKTEKKTRKPRSGNTEPRSLYILYKAGENGEINIVKATRDAKAVLKATMADKELKMYDYVVPKDAAPVAPQS